MHKGRTVLSIDFGTTNCKTAIIDETGRVLVEGHGMYPMHSPEPRKFEQYGAEWESILLSCLRALGPRAREVEMIAVTGQGSTSVCLDSAGKVIDPVISHLDRRFFQEGPSAPLPSMGYVATKMAGPLVWLKSNRPKAYRRVRRVLDVREYIGFLLTGVATHEASAFSEGIDGKFTELVGIAEDALGEPHDNETPVGSVNGRFASKSRLRKGTKVLLAPFDGLCSIVGVGIDRMGLLADVPGSTEVIATPVDSGSKFEVIPRALNGLSLFYTSPPLGSLYQWFRDRFYGTDVRAFARVERDASRSSPGSGGVLCVPHVAYSGFSADYSMSFHNISTSTTRRELARAVNEGLVFFAFDLVSKLSESGIDLNQVRVGAGGASNRLSNQIRADVFGMEVAIPQTLNVGCLGAAIYASVPAGFHGSVMAAIPKMVRVTRRYAPRSERHREYLQFFDEFRSIASKMAQSSHAAKV